MLTIERLIQLKGVIKWNAVFCEAGLNPNTMRSAVHHRRELRADEVTALLHVLERHGLVLTRPPGPVALTDEPVSAIAAREREPRYSSTSDD